MNPYSLIGGALLLSLLVGFGLYERQDAEHWHRMFDDRVSQEQTAADKAKADAQAQETKDLAALNSQSSKALSQAQAQSQQAQNQLQAYLAKGKASGGKDFGHQCFNVPIPADLLPK